MEETKLCEGLAKHCNRGIMGGSHIPHPRLPIFLTQNIRTLEQGGF